MGQFAIQFAQSMSEMRGFRMENMQTLASFESPCDIHTNACSLLRFGNYSWKTGGAWNKVSNKLIYLPLNKLHQLVIYACRRRGAFLSGVQTLMRWSLPARDPAKVIFSRRRRYKYDSRRTREREANRNARMLYASWRRKQWGLTS